MTKLNPSYINKGFKLNSKYLRRFIILLLMMFSIFLICFLYNFLLDKGNEELTRKNLKYQLLKETKEEHLDNINNYRWLETKNFINKSSEVADYSIKSKNFNDESFNNDSDSKIYKNSCTATNNFSSDKLVKVGILHSLTGTMSISENSVVDSVLLAIEEINNSGGVLGRKIEAILEDGASDWPTFSDMAQKLIDQENVDVVFGCWTSASRKSVLPIFEQKDHLLFYPVQYEGQECSKNIFYTGAAPNQQITPGVEWLAKTFPGKDFFLIGSDYVFPRTANQIINNQVKTSIGRNAWEQYIPLGSPEVDSVFQNITKLMPNGGIIFSTLNGDTNMAFFKKYKELGFTVDKYPTMSVSIAEEEVKSIGIDLLLGHYAVWNYFMTVTNKNNQDFIRRFFRKYGTERVINDPMEAAYIGVNIWKQAVEAAGTTEIKMVRKYAIGQQFEAPEGKVIMGANHHLSKYVRIGKINEKGLFDIIMETDIVEAQPWNKYIPEFANNKCDFSAE
jgi:urea transport system substrate-binding protein